jgi:hypothetical protein
MMAAKPRKSTKSVKAATAVQDAAAVVPEAAPAPAPDTAAAPKAPKADSYKMKELLTAVAQKSSAKKKDVKEIVDAVLGEITAALLRGQALSLPPLGNLRVAKTQEKDGAMLLALKLRIGPDGGSKARKKGAKDALAADGEDS